MRILVGIHGAHSQAEAMQAQRETWLYDLTGADYVFVLGRPATREPDILDVDCDDGPTWIQDGVICRRTWVLNKKTEALVRYAVDCGYDYVFKCDDDTFAQPARLLSSVVKGADYVGMMADWPRTYGGTFRWAQGGAGYWLSRRAMKVIEKYGLMGAGIAAEDVAVGELLALHGIPAINDDRYCHLDEGRDSKPVEGWITVHKVAAEEMRAMYRRTLPGLE